jgi:hypothetical protein
LGSEKLADQLKAFRDDRVGKILSGNGLIRETSSTVLVFHLIPINSFADRTSLDISSLATEHRDLGVHKDGTRSHLINFDGLVAYTYHNNRDNPVDYTQLFRNGAIETVEADMSGSGPDGKSFVSSKEVEKSLRANLHRNLTFFDKHGINPPFFGSITLFGVQGKTLATHQHDPHQRDQCDPFDRDIIVFPEFQIDDTAKSIDQILRPVFDLLWQAAGKISCPHFDESGNWISPP